MINNNLIYTIIATSGLSLILFVVYPNLDIKFSECFYTYQEGFVYRNNPLILFIFQAIPVLTRIFVIGILVHLLYNVIQSLLVKVSVESCLNQLANDARLPRDLTITRNDDVKKSILLLPTFYLLITISIGPGLIVNYILKDHFGRARPAQITYFHGNKEFTPAFVISNQCINNCSFSSGHAAISYYLTSVAYLCSSVYFTRIYFSAIFFGTMVGFIRILVGGHFLSDVIASCFIILIVNHLCYVLWKKLKSI